MRLTDFCHLNDNACTRTSCVPDSLRDFHRVDPHGLFGSVRMIGVPSVSRHSRTLRRTSADTHCLAPRNLPRLNRCVLSRAWAFSSHGACCKSSL